MLFKEILENGADLMSNDKSFVLTATYDGAVAQNTLDRHQRSMVAEPIGTTADGKVYTVYEVRDGQITIKEKQYPIKLDDGN